MVYHSTMAHVDIVCPIIDLVSFSFCILVMVASTQDSTTVVGSKDVKVSQTGMMRMWGLFL